MSVRAVLAGARSYASTDFQIAAGASVLIAPYVHVNRADPVVVCAQLHM